MKARARESEKVRKKKKKEKGLSFIKAIIAGGILS